MVSDTVPTSGVRRVPALSSLVRVLVSNPIPPPLEPNPFRMARNSQLNERRHGGSAPRTNPALIPGLVALALIGVAIGAAILSKKPKTDAQAAKPKGNP